MNELDFVFKKVIEIDRKSNEIKAKTKKEIADKEMELKNKLKALDDKELQGLKIELEKKYTLAIKDAKNSARKMLEETDKQASQIIENYNSIKDQLKQKLSKEIIKPN
ncbi:MAG TPA: hypothetical protein GXZ78_03940 [Eubacteriaceae bacterium]|nr:hypothetical protein [Eubacteriaceae bacterium]